MNYRRVLVFWLPLALSWLLMTFEDLWIQSLIGRNPDAALRLHWQSAVAPSLSS